jgi:hypothetical protein
MRTLAAFALFLVFQTTLPAENQQPPENATTDFIRVKEDDQSAHLQTTLTTYARDGKTVTLIGAIHIADQTYFETLNKKFTQHDVVLFELIGGEEAAQHLDGRPPENKDREKGAIEDLRGMYAAFSKMMQLVQQIDYIDYTVENFVHADLTLPEYRAIVADKGDQILAFAVGSAMRNSEISEKPFGGLDMGLVMQAMLSGDGSQLKHQYMQMMANGDESAGALAGENVVITDRNQKCFQVLSRELKQHDDIAIFYGAAHFPDMEKRLLADGFTRRDHQWLTAWEVEKETP